MHGLINRSLQSFLKDTYGAAFWLRIADATGAPPQGFETMEASDDALTAAMVDSAARMLGKPDDALLEDLGAYLCSRESLRRILRFSGATYADFLLSFDEFPLRARLAVPDLQVPEISLVPLGPGSYLLSCRTAYPGYVSVVAGILRAMADDYGVLAVIDRAKTSDTLQIDLLVHDFHAGRDFGLARPVSL